MSKHIQAEELASRILGQLDDALCVKLKELKDDLERLRDEFKDLNGGETIAGCKTWAEFCEKKLHRTDRAVRKMLAGAKSERPMEPQKPAEQSSADANAEQGALDPSETFDLVGETPTDDEHASVSDSEPGGYKPGVTYVDDLNAAKKKVRHLFSPLDSVDAIERNLNAILEGVIPCRKFKITVEEIEVELQEQKLLANQQPAEDPANGKVGF
jgi:hypothetical protein